MSDPGSNSNKLPALDQSPGVIRRQLSSSAAERKQRLQQQLQDESDSENSDDEMSFSSIDVRQYQAGGYNTLPNQEKVMPKPEAPSKGKRRRKKHHDLEIIEGLRDGVKFVDKPDIYQGYMLKKRRWPMKGWHKRYFNLDKGFLYYSKSPQDLQKCKFHGKIDVGMSVVAFKRYSHRIYIDAEDIVYHLKIKDDRLFSEWLKRIKNHRLYRQHELAYGNKDSPRLTEITSPTEELPDLKKSLNLKDRRDKPEMIRKASFNRESSQTRVANWLADTAGFESWNRELSHVRSMLVGLKEDMEEIRELPFLTDSSLTDSHEVEFTEKKKPRAWLGRRKERKHTDQHSLNSADISESSSVPTTPSEKNLRSSCSNPNLINYERNSRPRSVPEYSTPDNHEQRIKELKLREQFIGKAEEIYACMSSLLRTMGTERDRLKLAVDDSNDIPIINPTLPGHASSVISLRTSLADAYRQIAKLKTKLSRIHDESSMNIEPSRQLSSPLTTPLDFHEPRLSQSLSTESCAMSEYYDAEDFNKDSNSESSSEQSDDEEINSDNSDENNTEFSQHLSQSVSEEILMDKCQTGRRSKLPVPKPEGGDISMWNLLYRNIGKDLTKISMPVTLNEPLSMLQRLCEEMEYSELIDKALEMKDPYERMLYIAAFAVSSYASSGHRAGHKPFNPILGETYECVREDKGWKFIAEQVSHHPPISACHCDSKHYTFHQDVRIKTKFWGKSMEIQPTGVVKLHLPKFNDYYEWNKVTTCVHNLLGGKRWVDQYGEMQIRNGDIVCKLTFTKANNMSGKRHDIFGRIFNQDGKVVHNIFGKWNEALYCGHAPSAKCVWRPGAMPDDFELYYGFTRFAIELNELDPDQCKYLPPTDSRFRPDQRHLEEGRITESENEKHRVEQLQRERRKKMEAQRVHHESKWFRKTQQNGKELYEYNGLYWEKRKDPGFANMTFPKLW